MRSIMRLMGHETLLHLLAQPIFACCCVVRVGDQPPPPTSFTNILPTPTSAGIQSSADTSGVFANAVFQPINPLAASQAAVAKLKTASVKVRQV